MREFRGTSNAQIRSLRIEYRDGLGLRVAVASAIARRPSALQRVAVFTITVSANFSVIGDSKCTVAIVAGAQAGNRGHSRNRVTLYIHHIGGEGGELRSRRVIDGNLLNVLCEVLIAVIDTVCTANDILLIASSRENHVFIGHRDNSITVVHSFSMEAITWSVLRHGVTVDVSGQRGIAALQGQVCRGKRELRSCAVSGHQNLLD